ncbi:MAG TPA: IS1595 family transposase [Acidimicrobiia bacterium]|nr:IS1595 family transposase [Acidimicrobiia bacterium]
MSENRPPTNLIEAIRHFSDPDVCLAFVSSLRWPEGPVCPSCEGTRHSYLTTRRLWKCKACKRQFSVKVGTIFEDSPIGLDKWLTAIWIVANSKNGVSSHELGRSIGLTQKSAWFVLHRIRLAMQTGTFQKFSGEVEIDETFIGGKAVNMHADQRRRKITGRGGQGKTPVMGLKERGGDVQAFVMSGNFTRPVMQSYVKGHVESGTSVYTDSHSGYTGLESDFHHATVDHASYYVNGRVHTNGIENFWALLKRGLKGTYVQVAPAHLFRYLDERVFTFNKRDLTDFDRFLFVLGQTSGRRLTYEALTRA